MLDSVRRRLQISPAMWLRMLIVGGVLAGLLVVGVAAPRFPVDFMLVGIGMMAVLLLPHRIEWGVVGILVTAAFVRFEISTGTQSPIVASLMVSAMVLGLWLAERFVIRRDLQFAPAPTNVPLFGFVAAALISYVWSNAFRDILVRVWDTWPLVQLGALTVIVLLPGVYLLASNVLQNVRWLAILTGLVIAVGTLALARDVLNIGLPFLQVEGLFSMWFVAFTVSQAFFNEDLPDTVRLGLLGVASVWLYMYAIRRVTWLSGWLPAMVVVMILTFVRSKWLFLILVVALLLYFGLNFSYYRDVVFAAEYRISGQTRLAAWLQNFEVTGKHLLFGTGPAGYAVYYMTYFPREAMASHSNYIDVLAQMGVVGLAFSLWFFAALGWMGWKLWGRLRERRDFHEAFAVAGLAGWAGSVVAMAFGDWLFPFAYTQGIAGYDHAVYTWLLLGATAALFHITSREGAE